MFFYMDIFVLDTFLRANDEPPRHYHPQNHTRNGYRLALDVSVSSQQLAISTHLIHNYWTLLLLRFWNFPRVCRADTETISGSYEIQFIIQRVSKALPWKLCTSALYRYKLFSVIYVSRTRVMLRIF
jgi:hypothetical protein